MKFLVIILLAVAFVCFVFYALRRPSLNPAISLGLGLASWVLSELLSAFLKAFPLIIVTFLFFGCATNTADPAKNIRNAGINAAGSAALKDAGKVLGSVITSSLFSLAQSEIGGSQVKADLASSAASSVWSQVSTGQIDIGAGISHSITAYSDGKLRQTAMEAQKAADEAIAHGRSDAAVQNAVASVISTAAGAPPAK